MDSKVNIRIEIPTYFFLAHARSDENVTSTEYTLCPLLEPLLAFFHIGARHWKHLRLYERATITPTFFAQKGRKARWITKSA